MGVTEFSRMMGTDPDLALSVPEDLGRREAGRVAGGMDAKRKGWGRLQARAGETSSSSSSGGGGGGRHPPQDPENPLPPRAPKKRPHHFERSDEEAPPSQGQQGKPKAKAKAQAKGKGKAIPPPPPPQTPSPPLARKGPGPLWECAGCPDHLPSDGVGAWG